jgi:hypothetical protein
VCVCVCVCVYVCVCVFVKVVYKSYAVYCDYYVCRVSHLL